MYEFSGVRRTIKREKFVPTKKLPELPKFGGKSGVTKEPKFFESDEIEWNVPRVGKLKKTNFLNRPWLIRKEKIMPED